MQRIGNRAFDALRSMRLTIGISEYADGSVLFECGKTKVHCSVSLGNSVPPFLYGKNKWWLTASYALLPTSTKVRIEREAQAKRNERSVEISRFIGRSLRSIVDLTQKNSEKTIFIDCDVLQADGGTRTACISGAFAALRIAERKWLEKGIIDRPLIQDEIAAISVGLLNNTVLLDVDFQEDSNVQADFNFVLTRSGDIVEIQGTAEQSPISWQSIESMRSIALKGVGEILNFIDNALDPLLKKYISTSTNRSIVSER